MPQIKSVLKRIGLTEEQLLNWGQIHYPHLFSEKTYLNMKTSESLTVLCSSIKPRELKRILITSWLKKHGYTPKIKPSFWRTPIKELEAMTSIDENKVRNSQKVKA